MKRIGVILLVLLLGSACVAVQGPVEECPCSGAGGGSCAVGSEAEACSDA